MADIPNERVEFNDGKYALLHLGPGRYAWQLYDDPPQLTFSNRDIAVFHEVEEMRADKQRLSGLYREAVEALRPFLEGETNLREAERVVEQFDALLKEK